jgi:hypothetical protein
MTVTFAADVKVAALFLRHLSVIRRKTLHFYKTLIVIPAAEGKLRRLKMLQIIDEVNGVKHAGMTCSGLDQIRR